MLIGRSKEQEQLLSLLKSDQSEFVAIYGRRRVGKTYLIRQTYKNKFAFQHSGLAKGTMEEQLEEFQYSLINAGMQQVPKLKSWSQAFFLLGQFLATLPYGKKVVFIDELPWMETPKSKLVSALEHFWNGWASAREDIVLVVCGSATSWIIKKIVRDHGGLHDRLTRQISLSPFTLKECEQYAKKRKLGLSRKNILETYMVLGGIPFYWSLLQPKLSSAQNIDELIFAKNGELRNEFDALYASLFRSPQVYIDIVTTLATKKIGMTYTELRKEIEIDTNIGGKLTDKLEELEQCDFIRSYPAIGKTKKDTLYQLIDNFTLFYFKFIAENTANNAHYWTNSLGKPTYNTWGGLAYERVCMQHEQQIKGALGISGIDTNVYSWTYRAKTKKEKGAQIDMLIDRGDDVINVCEMKYYKNKYSLTEKELENILEKINIFEEKTKTNKVVRPVMITSYGLVDNEYANEIPNQLTMTDLFE